MNDTLFERLLYEEESTTLDFKRDQYHFVKASDDEKAELLKDILGFANAWRRSDAYILIGVEDVRGGRANVVGIAQADHLDDHSLQQFVNNRTSRPIRFHYEAFSFEGKQVGVIRVEEQTRPIYLKKDFGKLKKGEVYVRRGSSTDPTKPADPDEIAQMGSGLAAGANQASLAIEFAKVDRQQALGAYLEWSAEYCEMPTTAEIPTYDDRPAPITLPDGQLIAMPDISSISLHDRRNPHFYRERANYTFFKRAIKKVRLVVINTGEVLASDVRVEILIPNGQGYGIFDWNKVPDVPKRRTPVGHIAQLKNLAIRRATRVPGEVEIQSDDEQTKIEIDCGSLQPGRKVWTNAFFMGIAESNKIKLTGHIFAANLSAPQEFTLTIKAMIAKTQMSIDELLALDESTEQEM
jgi:hypothetical protein